MLLILKNGLLPIILCKCNLKSADFETMILSMEILFNHYKEKVRILTMDTSNLGFPLILFHVNINGFSRFYQNLHGRLETTSQVHVSISRFSKHNLSFSIPCFPCIFIALFLIFTTIPHFHWL